MENPSKIPVFKMAHEYSDMGAKKVGTIDRIENINAIIKTDVSGDWIAIVGIGKMDSPDNFVQIHNSHGKKHQFMGYNSFGILVSDKLAAFTIIANGMGELFNQPEFARLRNIEAKYITADDVEGDFWVNKTKNE